MGSEAAGVSGPGTKGTASSPADVDRWGWPLISVMLRHRQGLGLSIGQVESLERLRADDFIAITDLSVTSKFSA